MTVGPHYHIRLFRTNVQRDRNSPKFLRAGDNPVVKGLPFTLVSLVAGWWGIPWGPIYTVQSIYNNSRGGKDVTQAVVNSLRGQAAKPPAAGPIPPQN
jgi:hypothetical protein